MHGLGGGSSEVKTPYEITPLQGLKNYLGNEVNINVMRARSSELAPIAADYIASRHWTGTPAWHLSRYSDLSRTLKIEEAWSVSSQYNPTESLPESESLNIITMSAEVKPIKSGIHTLRVETHGDFLLTIDGQEVMSYQGKGSNKERTKDITLVGGQHYKFKVDYQGKEAFVLGWNAPGELFSSEKEYMEAAKNADAVIYFGGLSHGDDREAIDRLNMKLPSSQDEVIGNLLQANDNTIVFLVAGSAVEMPWEQEANTLVWGWYGGMEAGNAFAEMLFGETNPSGKLPITLARNLSQVAPIALDDYNAKESLYSEGVFIGYRWFEQQNIKPMFSFGHGLSYTTFEFSELQLSHRRLQKDEQLTVSVKVKNVGNVAGAGVVQLYLSDLVSSVPRPKYELKGFDKVQLAPQESKTVTLILNKRDLSFWDVSTNDWLAETGEFRVNIGHSLSNIILSKSFNYHQ